MTPYKFKIGLRLVIIRLNPSQTHPKLSVALILLFLRGCLGIWRKAQKTNSINSLVTERKIIPQIILLVYFVRYYKTLLIWGVLGGLKK